MINLQLKIINVEINVKSVLLIYSLEKNISISLLVRFHLLRFEILLKNDNLPRPELKEYSKVAIHKLFLSLAANIRFRL